MKKFILGLMTGVFIMAAVPLTAAIEEFVCYRADYKLVINGVEYQDEEIPLLNYKGQTVGSVKKILDAVGMEVMWNAELGQAEVRKKVSGTSYVVEKQETERPIVKPPINSRDNQPVYIKSDIIQVNQNTKYKYIIKEGDFYLETDALAHYKEDYLGEGTKYLNLQIPGSSYKIVINGKEVRYNKVRSATRKDWEFAGQKIYFKLKAFDLEGRLEGDTLYIE